IGVLPKNGGSAVGAPTHPLDHLARHIEKVGLGDSETFVPHRPAENVVQMDRFHSVLIDGSGPARAATADPHLVGPVAKGNNLPPEGSVSLDWRPDILSDKKRGTPIGQVMTGAASPAPERVAHRDRLRAIADIR